MGCANFPFSVTPIDPSMGIVPRIPRNSVSGFDSPQVVAQGPTYPTSSELDLNRSHCLVHRQTDAVHDIIPIWREQAKPCFLQAVSQKVSLPAWPCLGRSGSRFVLSPYLWSHVARGELDTPDQSALNAIRLELEIPSWARRRGNTIRPHGSQLRSTRCDIARLLVIAAVYVASAVLTITIKFDRPIVIALNTEPQVRACRQALLANGCAV